MEGQGQVPVSYIYIDTSSSGQWTTLEKSAMKITIDAFPAYPIACRSIEAIRHAKEYITCHLSADFQGFLTEPDIKCFMI